MPRVHKLVGVNSYVTVVHCTKDATFGICLTAILRRDPGRNVAIALAASVEDYGTLDVLSIFVATLAIPLSLGGASPPPNKYGLDR